MVQGFQSQHAMAQPKKNFGFQDSIRALIADRVSFWNKFTVSCANLKYYTSEPEKYRFWPSFTLLLGALPCCPVLWGLKINCLLQMSVYGQLIKTFFAHGVVQIVQGNIIFYCVSYLFKERLEEEKQSKYIKECNRKYTHNRVYKL